MPGPQLRYADGKFHIEGNPKAVKIGSLANYGAPRQDVQFLCDLAKHRKDLDYVWHAATRLLEHPNDPEIVREALWRSAIVTLWRCFDKNSRRFPLEPKKVYDDELPRDILDYFRVLRNKDLAHDDGLTTGAELCAVIGPDEGEDKVLEVLYIQTTGVHSSPQSVSNLRRLAEHAVIWSGKEFEKRAQELVGRLRELPYAELLQLPEPQVEIKQFPNA